MSVEEIEKVFPNLRISGYSITSPATPEYNCIAWAAGEAESWWEPDPLSLYYWPSNTPRQYTAEAYIKAYEKIGYTVCNNSAYEEDFEKIKPERDRLNTIFLLTGDELSFITTLEQIAHNRQLAEHKIDLQPARSGFFPLRLTLSGTFEQVMGYVSDIESLSQYYIIDNLSVATSRIENGTEPAAIRLNLSGKIYSREPEKL